MFLRRLDQLQAAAVAGTEGGRMPFFSPDAWIVFRSTRDGGGLFWKAADGTGEVERLFESSGGPRPLGWAADGRLVFDQAPGDIGALTIEGERTAEMLLATAFDERLPALSPDGRWIAHESNESSLSDIYVRPFPNVDDGKWQVSTVNGFDPVWSPDGRRLFFQQDQRMMVTEVETDLTFNPGMPTQVFGMGAYPFVGAARAFDLAPDGQRFLMRRIGGSQTSGDRPFDGFVFVENWHQELLDRVPVP